MQSSPGQPPHGPSSSPTDHSHHHPPVSNPFHTPEPSHSSQPFFTMNPLTDQRLTGSMMPYQPVDHHSLSWYVHLVILSEPVITLHSCTHLSASTYQDTVPWQYAASWNAPVLDPSASSEDPSSTPLHSLGGMVSASHEGSTFAPQLPRPRALQTHNLFLGTSQA
ncbi:hypothetical protein BJV74DRAFT_168054 [Russula compacta]|nr:hypothetical protein BJV74DRAFT_168054 [Russula compacta]